MEINTDVLNDIAASITKYARVTCGIYSKHDSRYGLSNIRHVIRKLLSILHLFSMSNRRAKNNNIVPKNSRL